MQTMEKRCTNICKLPCEALDIDEVIKNCNNCHISNPEYNCNINDTFYNESLTNKIQKYNIRFDNYKQSLQ